MPVGRTGRRFIEWRVSGFLKRKRSRDVLRAIERGMLAAASEAIPTVQRFTPVDQDLLRQSYGVVFRKNPRRARIVSSSDPRKVAAMELGRRPGRRFPPVPLIRAWVQRKLNPPESEVDRVAFLVGRKISIQGYRPPLQVSGKGGMFRRASARLGPRFFSERVSREVRRLR